MPSVQQLDQALQRLGLRSDRPLADGLSAALAELAPRLSTSHEALCARIATGPLSDPLVQDVAERLAVGESTFFRHGAQFEAFEKIFLPERARRRPHQRLRLLSAGSAKGEEAYSLAIACERGAPGVPYDVVALDLSSRMLRQVAEGFYRPWSFRGADPQKLSPWLLPEGDGFRVMPRLRERVTPVCANLLELPRSLLGDRPFDAIFCRNVLIYYRAAAGRAVVAALSERLEPGGLLFVGPADHDFCVELARAQLGDVTVYGQRGEAPAAPPALRAEPEPQVPSPPLKAAPKAAPPRDGIATADQYPVLLARGRTARDAGQAEEALGAFEAAIALSPGRSDAYVEQGLLLEKQGHSVAARQLLERALYLDPCHAPATLLLARLLSGEGPRGKARARVMVEQLSESLEELAPTAALPLWDEMNAGALKRACRSLLASREPR